MKVSINELSSPAARAALEAGETVAAVDADGRVQFYVSHGSDEIPCCDEVVRYREALEKIAADAGRCQLCASETPEGVAPLARHHIFTSTDDRDGVVFACEDHAAKEAAAVRKGESSCGAVRIWPRHEQPYILIALAALESK